MSDESLDPTLDKARWAMKEVKCYVSKRWVIDDLTAAIEMAASASKQLDDLKSVFKDLLKIWPADKRDTRCYSRHGVLPCDCIGVASELLTRARLFLREDEDND